MGMGRERRWASTVQGFRAEAGQGSSCARATRRILEQLGPLRVVELGTAYGEGAELWAHLASQVECVDPMYEWVPDVHGEADPSRADAGKIAAWTERVGQHARLVLATSLQAPPRLLPGIDVLVIDGVHHPYEAVLEDERAYRHLMSPEGYLLVWDDVSEADVCLARSRSIGELRERGMSVVAHDWENACVAYVSPETPYVREVLPQDLDRLSQFLQAHASQMGDVRRVAILSSAPGETGALRAAFPSAEVLELSEGAWALPSHSSVRYDLVVACSVLMCSPDPSAWLYALRSSARYVLAMDSNRAWRDSPDGLALGDRDLTRYHMGTKMPQAHARSYDLSLSPPMLLETYEVPGSHVAGFETGVRFIALYGPQLGHPRALFPVSGAGLYFPSVPRETVPAAAAAIVPEAAVPPILQEMAAVPRAAISPISEAAIAVGRQPEALTERALPVPLPEPAADPQAISQATQLVEALARAGRSAASFHEMAQLLLRTLKRF